MLQDIAPLLKHYALPIDQKLSNPLPKVSTPNRKALILLPFQAAQKKDTATK